MMVMRMNDVEQYVRKNKDKLHRLAKHGDTVVRAMALAILKQAGEDIEEEKKKESANSGDE